LLKIAVTGQIASGKSTTSRLLAARGGFLVDVDEEVHKLLLPHTDTYLDVRTHFGDKIVDQDGTINRKKLADIVFNNPEELEFLEKIIHPKITEIILEKIATADQRDKKFVVIDVPLLEKSGIKKLVDVVIVVEASFENQLNRCKSEGMSEEQANLRLAAQPDFAELRKDADIILSNNGALDDLRKEIDELFEKNLGRLLYRKNPTSQELG
jgi:dephospho-CoA kinase